MLGRSNIAGCVAALLVLLAPIYAQSGDQSPQSRGHSMYRAQTGNSQAPQHGNPQGSQRGGQTSRNQPGHAGRGCGATRICRRTSSAGRWKTIRSSGGCRRNNKCDCATSSSISEPASAAAGAHAGPHGNVGASDGGAEAAGADAVPAISGVAAGAAASAERSDSGMRGMTPEQRSRLINSDQFNRRFTPYERNLLSSASRLPLGM